MCRNIYICLRFPSKLSLFSTKGFLPCGSMQWFGLPVCQGQCRLHEWNPFQRRQKTVLLWNVGTDLFFCETNDLKFRTHLRHTSMNLVYKRLKVVVGILDSNKNAWKNQVGNHQAIHERTGYLGSVRRKSFGNPSGNPPKTWRPISILGIHLFLVIWQMWEKILTVHKGWYWGEKRSQHILINHVLWRFGMI